MASRTKISDQSWFYHAPSKPKPRSTSPAPVPPISQIPGLSNVSHLPDEDPCTRLWIRESDSDYIRLAKQGGRPDLLMMRPTKPPSEPVGYPRCEWFYDSYTDPNQPKQPEQPYEFLLPDYMVHQPLRRRCEQKVCGDYGAESAPYAFDKSTVYEREGHQANDKTVKLEEQRKLGYGVRTEKQQKQRATKSQNQGVKGDSDEGNVSGSMSKILSYGYTSDYDTQRERYQHEKCKISEKEKETIISNSRKHTTAKNQKGNPCRGGRKR